MEACVSAVNILAQGKRNMVCGEIPTAVNQFQEACTILSKACLLCFVIVIALYSVKICNFQLVLLMAQKLFDLGS
jgi:hypothetical protein